MKLNRITTRTVGGAAFVRGLTQHVVPSGFQKIGHYGRMSANSKISLDDVKWLPLG
ncbi:transposase [Rhodopirellula europaea SH398]|uniref:Transposase n=1 Tax=Rhodopirellula europaea SH398 TaxID=1263868 RepID=M5RZG8_9BACT|nr:transposase [Rhodopirellula europaea SH398]